jgi:CRISPR/Cas system-associated endonuclease Cas1
MAAALDPAKTASIAAAIVAVKITAERHDQNVIDQLLVELSEATLTDGIRHIEAKAAQLWWRQWRGFEINGAEWGPWPGRYIPRRQGLLGELQPQRTARAAMHPLQALHNYAVGVLASRLTRVVIARGLDPCFGFLHDGRVPGRLRRVFRARGRQT